MEIGGVVVCGGGAVDVVTGGANAPLELPTTFVAPTPTLYVTPGGSRSSVAVRTFAGTVTMMLPGCAVTVYERIAAPPVFVGGCHATTIARSRRWR